jgi:hypothetical protein
VLNDTTYRDNARYFQKVIAETDGLSRAADLLERSFGLTIEAELPLGRIIDSTAGVDANY